MWTLFLSLQLRSASHGCARSASRLHPHDAALLRPREVRGRRRAAIQQSVQIRLTIAAFVVHTSTPAIQEDNMTLQIPQTSHPVTEMRLLKSLT